MLPLSLGGLGVDLSMMAVLQKETGWEVYFDLNKANLTLLNVLKLLLKITTWKLVLKYSQLRRRWELISFGEASKKMLIALS